SNPAFPCRVQLGPRGLESGFFVAWKGPAGKEFGARSGNIEPVWSRLNIWLPWKRWNPSDSTSLPRFEPFATKAALIMATGARPDGPFSVPDLYRDYAGSR